MTIEERARAKYRYIPSYHNTRNALETAYKEGATEQDPISRADERNRVIEKACEWLSKHLPNTTDEDIMYDNITVCDRDMIVEQFKQAMEE